MKKIALTLAIVLGLSMTTFADGGGLSKTLTKCPWAPASPSWQPLAAPTSWPRNAERNNRYGIGLRREIRGIQRG